jgi:hypothetical protein
MALTGSQFTVYRNEDYVTEVTNNVFHNSWVLDQRFFDVVGPGESPGGASIDFIIDYSETTNAGTFTVGTPMPDEDTTNSIRAYFNKDYYHASAKTYKILKNQMIVNRNGTNVPINPDQKAIDKASKNLIDVISTTCYADLATQVDSAAAFSDASLTRATYGIAASETAVGGVQTLAHLEDAVEQMEDVTYGPVQHDDILIMMPRNQLTNHSRLVSGAAYRELNASADGSGYIDGGSVSRISTFDGVDIMVVPDMTTTEILVVQKSAIKVFVHMALDVVYKDLKEAADSWYLTMGVNIVNTNPRSGVKYTGVTA